MVETVLKAYDPAVAQVWFAGGLVCSFHRVRFICDLQCYTQMFALYHTFTFQLDKQPLPTPILYVRSVKASDVLPSPVSQQISSCIIYYVYLNCFLCPCVPVQNALSSTTWPRAFQAVSHDFARPLFVQPSLRQCPCSLAKLATLCEKAFPPLDTCTERARTLGPGFDETAGEEKAISPFVSAAPVAPEHKRNSICAAQVRIQAGDMTYGVLRRSHSSNVVWC